MDNDIFIVLFYSCHEWHGDIRELRSIEGVFSTFDFAKNL